MLKHWACMCTFVPFDSLVYFLSFHLGCNLPKLAMCTQGMKFFAFFYADLPTTPLGSVPAILQMCMWGACSQSLRHSQQWPLCPFKPWGHPGRVLGSILLLLGRVLVSNLLFLGSILLQHPGRVLGSILLLLGRVLGSGLWQVKPCLSKVQDASSLFGSAKTSGPLGPPTLLVCVWIVAIFMIRPIMNKMEMPGATWGLARGHTRHTALIYGGCRNMKRIKGMA